MACRYLTTGAKGKARSITSLAGNAPVAGRAVHTGKETKAMRRLAVRIADWQRGTQSHDSKVKLRWIAGFHKPGSLQCK